MMALCMPVVVGITGGPSDYEFALQYAAEAARRRRAAVRVVHGCEPFSRLPRMDDPEAARRRRREGRHQARIAARRLRDLLPAGRDVSVSTPAGTGPEALVAESANASLVVLQRRDLSTLKRISAGSTTSAVAARSACPVVVVRPSAPGGAGDVVVGVDSAGHAEAALSAAFDEAEARGVGITAVHAWQWQENAFELGYAPTTSEEIFQAAATHRSRLTEMLAGHAARHPAVPARVVVESAAIPQALVDASVGARLLVVSRHKATAKQGALGSIARHCINDASCPVMVVAGSRPGSRTPASPADPGRSTLAPITGD